MMFFWLMQLPIPKQDGSWLLPTDPDYTTIDYLLSSQAVRDRCRALFDLACTDELANFRCNLDKLDGVAEYVIQTMQAAYPTGEIPIHSRWRHFEAGGRSRLAAMQQPLSCAEPLELARSHIDLVVTSVLLDAGAGADWCYREADTQQVFRRSEGLAVASLHLFQQGGFSSLPDRPLQADAIGLQAFTIANFQQAFQVTETNPLIGVAGRVDLMQRLGAALQQHPMLFGQRLPRPGNLVDYFVGSNPLRDGKSGLLTIPVGEVLEAVLVGFGSIWAGRRTLAGVNLGDVWQHSALPDRTPSSQLVPFHKLSQWLTYSLLEPLQLAGITITDLDALTGLPEYRNGGLFIDLGVLQANHPDVTRQVHAPEAEVIVEWRALTVSLLDCLADRIRRKLGRTAVEFPLAKMLEGGTCAARRRIAAELRPGGVPPIQVHSDGTVF